MRLAALVLFATLLATSSTPRSTQIGSVSQKKVIVGLIDKGSEAPYHRGLPFPIIDLTDVSGKSPAFSGVVINQTWAQLEPSQGTYDFATLDASLAAVSAYNRRHQEAALGVRLRIFAAYAAPDWAKDLEGPPVTVPARTSGNTGGTLGQWWKSSYRSAWAKLQQVLADRYDDDPLVREVAVSSCTTLTAEPFVMAPATIVAATADGWTSSAQAYCLDGAFSDYAPWTHTAIYYPMNPLIGSSTITDEVMNRCVESAIRGGPTCILANNALSPVSDSESRSAPVYAEIDSLWSANPHDASVAFQMNGPNASTYCQSIAVAVRHHAQSVELWPATPGNSGYSAVATTSLVAWGKDLRSGTEPGCTSSP